MTDTKILQQLCELSTTDLSDAMDKLGIQGQCLGIMPLDRTFQLTGKAFTVHYVPVGVDGGSVGDFIDDVEPGSVVVIDNCGRVDATVWGDILTMTAHRNNIAGTVIDGVCRDVDRSIELNYPIYSKGNWMRTGKDRVTVDTINVPVSIGGVLVKPGDFLRGDGDGVVAIPSSKIEMVITEAQRIHEAEEKIRECVLNGEKLVDVRRKFSYHQLQTKK
jgi:4-hydroxy-4-methyl-2-oxoglutarate aldolase